LNVTLKVLVKTGEKVKKGDILVTVEGMKLEVSIAHNP